jgi:hypothetical protein
MTSNRNKVAKTRKTGRPKQQMLVKHITKKHKEIVRTQYLPNVLSGATIESLDQDQLATRLQQVIAASQENFRNIFTVQYANIVISEAKQLRSGTIIAEPAKHGAPRKKRTGIILNPAAVAESQRRAELEKAAESVLKLAEEGVLTAANVVLDRIKEVLQTKPGQILSSYHVEMKSLHLAADGNINRSRSLIKLQVRGKQMAADLTDAMSEMRKRAIVVPAKDWPYTPPPSNFVFTASQNSSSSAAVSSFSSSSKSRKRTNINASIAGGINRIDKSLKHREAKLISAANDYVAVSDQYLNKRGVKYNSLTTILPLSSSLPSHVTPAQIEAAVQLLERAQKERRNAQIRSDTEAYATKNAETALYLIVSEPPVVPFDQWTHFVGQDDTTASMLSRLVKAFHEGPSRPTEVSQRILNE